MLCCWLAACTEEKQAASPPEESDNPVSGDDRAASNADDASMDDDGAEVPDAAAPPTDESPIDTPDPDPDPMLGDAPTRHIQFDTSDENFLNPERGFYTTTNLATVRDLDYVRPEGKSIVYAAVHLDAYLGEDHEQPLPEELLSDVQSGFDAVRDAGLKAVVRFQYDDGEGYPDGANDAPESWMLQHIEQLAPLLQANQDVLFLLQAGLIGAWGEWHSSLNFEDGPSDQEARKRIVDGLLAALPESRRVALRYPAYKRMLYGAAATTESTLLMGDAVGRVAHLNDCFVSGENDVGTYQYESPETLKDYLAEDTLYVPIGGETCAVHERNACDVVLPEMERFHYSYLNDDYHPDVLARWDEEGCRPEIERRLGYRLSLVSAEVPEQIKPGGSFILELQLVNTGFAAPTNPRPLMLRLRSDDADDSVQLPLDVRTLTPGEHGLSARVRLPAQLSPGQYTLALWLPDADPTLASRSEYSVRLLNPDVWSEQYADNALATLTVAASAPGEADAAATDLAVE